jgi:hypothetical protein
MTHKPRRILATNDFIGSFFPQPTSDGWLPGGAALQTTIDELRDRAAASLWIDTGDLTQGSALGALTDGAWPFLALRDFNIDMATLGNHELDWGRDHLALWGSELPFPLLAANADLGLPATHLADLAGRTIGVIGITYPHMPVLHPEISVDEDAASLIHEHAARLRDDGAETVILALHDGVDVTPDAGGLRVDSQRIEVLVKEIRETVDLILAGHTLGHHCNTIAGVPLLQPWPFSAEVGVADIAEDGAITISCVPTGPPRAWTGLGAAAQRALEDDIVGHLARPLRSTPGIDRSLPQAIADGLLEIDPTIDLTAIVAVDLWTQAPRDGTFAYLPAGDVSEAQILRVTPTAGGRSAWGGQLVAAELPVADARRVAHTLASEPYFPGGPSIPGTIAHRHPNQTSGACVIALLPFYAARADILLGKPAHWHTCTSTWRDGLRAAVAR